MTRYVVVGMGIAGISTAETLRSLDSSAEIFIIGNDPHGFYSRPGLAYSLDGEIPEKLLYLYTERDWKALKIHHIHGHVTRLDTIAHTIEVDPVGLLAYDRLMLATGASGVPLKIPGSDLHGVVKLDTFEDDLEIISWARRAKTALVVGGGIVAVEIVEGLVARKVKVHYLLRGDRYWSNVLDEAESILIENRLEHHGVLIHHQTEIAQILGRNGKVAAVETTKGEVITCGMVAVGIGVRPRMELAQAAALKTERGIMTNEYFQTSDPDVFAAGDVAQVFDLATNRSLIDNLWYPAREQGRLAAYNMAGQRTPYRRSVTVNVLRLARIMMTIIGAVGSGRDDDLVSVARGSSETWRQLPNTLSLESGNEDSHLRLMVGERTLQGALILGDQKISFPLQEMISSQADITPIRSQLLQPDGSLGEIIMDFWSRKKLEEKKDAAQK